MKTIERDHKFSNRINMIKQTDKQYFIYREKSKPVFVSRTQKLDAAFKGEDWDSFRDAERDTIESLIQ